MYFKIQVFNILHTLFLLQVGVLKKIIKDYANTIFTINLLEFDKLHLPNKIILLIYLVFLTQPVRHHFLFDL
jgi:hypothetical protein